MKQISFFFLLLLASLSGLQAQALTLTGIVGDNGTPVPNHLVYVEVGTGGTIIGVDTLTTDAQGFFSATYPALPPFFNSGIITLTTMDCNNLPIIEVLTFSPNVLNLVATIEYCSTTSQVCQADFAYTQPGILGNVVFANLSSGGTPVSPLSYQWDLGDGTTSVVANPVHTYTQPGTYVVCLMIDDNLGCVDTTCQVITTFGSSQCQADFAHFMSATGVVSFTPIAASGNVSYFWDFGDGIGTSTSSTPTYTYSQPGVYQACLTVVDSVTGCANTWCDLVFVGQGGLCHAGFTYQGGGNNSYFFFDQSFSGISGGGAPLTYQWDFGDGGTSNIANPVYTYGQSGIFSVCLIISDASGCSDTTCATLVVPGANGCIANYSYSVDPTGTAHFLSTSTGSNLIYAWDFGDGNTGTTDCPVNAYTNPGNYLVCLTITDTVGGCTDTYCDSLTVGTVGGGFCAANYSYVPIGPDTYQFFDQSTSVSQLPVGAIVSWSWDFGDGSPIDTTANPIHTFPQTGLGVFNVCLTITDVTGCTSVFCSPVFITGGNPCQGFYTYSINPGLSVDFVSFPNSPQTHTYDWDFGDGTPADTTANPNHVFPNPGTYQVCVAITENATGCFVWYCDSVTVSNSQSSCQADFSYQTSGSGIVYFFDQSQGSSPSGQISYLWDFGDGTTDITPFPVHTYAQSGTYPVCLIISDPSGLCADTLCQTVTIGATQGCTASFNHIMGLNQTVYFQSASTGLGLIYSWTFGDGTGSIGPVVDHTYASADTYTVCLTIVDPINNCTDTYCDNIVIAPGSGSGCQAGFVSVPSPTGGFQFINTSTPDPAVVFPSSSVWDFGDGTTSASLSPNHVFSGTGPYTVCLIYSAAGCADTVCQTIGGYSVSGAVYAGNVISGGGFVNDGIAYLIQHDPSAGTLTAVDSVPLTQSYYSFQNVSPGSYLVKAALEPSSPVYANFLPTYLGDELFWNTALSVIVTNTHIFNPDINLVGGVNPGGPGFIGGLISQGANKTEGDPLANLSVLLLDASDNPISHTTTDAQGQYTFGDLAYGTYHIYVEIPGLLSSPRVVTISADNPFVDWADFSVNSTGVTTGIEEQLMGQEFLLYPNPAKDRVKLVVEVNEPIEGKISVLNLMGQTLIEESVRWNVGSHEQELILTDLPEGTYFVVLRAGNQLLSKRLVKGL